mmetsp:Transcript_101738/g.232949  ORF Transcript_101738/g.232949 Transcript_101738/m.232949 type:complete len:516 (-) Transcript_101738:222-1769(-)
MSEMMATSEYEYDLIVIGGGSGGMAASKEAAKLGAKVALFDFVKPSSQGTKWGLGGTCVNVGCVPKKLMHYTALMGASFHDAKHFGWSTEHPRHNWEEMVDSVQNHVKMLNFRYRVGLKSNRVKYFNALATFSGPHEVTFIVKGKEYKATAQRFLIAVGGRPVIPDVPGAREVGLTSDDIFSTKTAPGKTLVVGASYIALECAGFLTELGYPVTVAVRSVLLRGFDQQCAEKIGANMEAMGTRFYKQCVPSAYERLGSGKIQVTLSFTGEGEERTELFDTVLFATGRHADTAGLNLECTGVVAEANGKFLCPDAPETTNVAHIHAVGDVLHGRLELTPVAVRAGILLAKRLYGGSGQQMDYDLVATTVFTPFEYGCCGLSEEEAVARHGEENIETYLFEFSSLELQAAHRTTMRYTDAGPEAEEDVDLPAVCLSKLVCLKTEDERVLGFHFVGPNAGEMTQGFGLTLKLGAKKADFDEMVGIHPTDAESFATLEITRASGQAWLAEGGCGGGVCG